VKSLKGFKDLFQVKKTIEDKTNERYQLFLTEDKKNIDSDIEIYNINLVSSKHDIIVSGIQNIKKYFEKKLKELS